MLPPGARAPAGNQGTADASHASAIFHTADFLALDAQLLRD